MVTPKCSRCGRVIPGEDVNVGKDVAYCRPCNVAHPLSSLAHGAALETGVDLNRPPPGCWHRQDVMGVVTGATHRSLGATLGLLAVSLFWNGIVSVFVLLALSSTLRLLEFSLPEWFPAPKMNDQAMGVGMTIFLWIFLTPFIAIGLAMIGGFLSALGGRTEFRLNRTEGVIYTGIGPLGWRRRFMATDVKEVRIDNQQWRDSDGDRRSKTNIIVELHSGRLIKFGSMLREDRRKFVAAAVARTLAR